VTPHACFTLTLAAALAAPSPARAATPSPEQIETWANQVRSAEEAFARSLAERRLDHFAELVAEDAVFRGATLHIGRTDIVASWKKLFDAPQAPFSWKPDLVTVSADGDNALSTGPVLAPDGQVTGRFMTIWHHDADGHWRARVDQGVDPGPCPTGKP